MSTLKNSIYALADLFTLYRGVPRSINGFRIKFPARWARYFEADYEKENVAFLSDHCKEGMTIIDVGAHLGLMSVILARLAGSGGKVFAFEPTPGTFQTLKRIIRLNGAENNVVPVNKAVAGTDGQIDFYIDEQNEGSNANSLVNRIEKKRKTVKMDVVSLDRFVRENKLERVDLIKIDAEGVELDVLNGARDCISRFRPKIILAVHPSLIKNNGQRLDELFTVIENYNYRILFKGNYQDREQFCRQSDFFDVYLIP